MTEQQQPPQAPAEQAAAPDQQSAEDAPVVDERAGGGAVTTKQNMKHATLPTTPVAQVMGKYAPQVWTPKGWAADVVDKPTVSVSGASGSVGTVLMTNTSLSAATAHVVDYLKTTGYWGTRGWT